MSSEVRMGSRPGEVLDTTDMMGGQTVGVTGPIHRMSCI